MDYSDYRSTMVRYAVVKGPIDPALTARNWEPGTQHGPLAFMMRGPSPEGFVCFSLQVLDPGFYDGLRFVRPSVEATEDAPAEDVQAYHAAVKVETDARAAAQAKAEKERALAEWRKPLKGRKVKVVRGRKVPIGTIGVVAWTGRDDYGRSEDRIGLKVEGNDKLVYTAARNCVAFVPARPSKKAAHYVCPACDWHPDVDLEFPTEEALQVHLDEHLSHGEDLSPEAAQFYPHVRAAEEAAEKARQADADKLYRKGFRSNKYGGKCWQSGQWVEPGKGWIRRQDGKWTTFSHAVAMEWVNRPT